MKLITVTKSLFLICALVVSSYAQKPDINRNTTGTLGATRGGTAQTSWTKGDLLCASASNTLTKLTVGTDGYSLVADAASTCGVKWSASSGINPYIVGSFLESAPANSQVMLRHVVPVAIDIATNCATSQAKLGTAATASTVFDIQKNGSSFGSATFASSGTTATFSCTHTTFSAGDIITVVAPSSADATAAKFTMSLYATR